MGYILTKNTIERLINLARTNTEEMCCFLIENNSYITIDESSCNRGGRIPYKQAVKEGSYDPKFRATCEFKVVSKLQKFPNFLLHTHPDTSKPYPSYEDIRSVFKNVHVKAELIAVRDGLWIISTNEIVKRHIRNHYIDREKGFDRESFDRKFKKGISTYLNQIYSIFVEDRNATLIYDRISEILYTLNSKYDIVVQFYNWNEIKTSDFKFYI